MHLWVQKRRQGTVKPVGSLASLPSRSYVSVRAKDSSSRGRSSASSSPLRPLDADRRDAALLEVDPPAGEVVHDLRERRVVADDEHARVVAVGISELERVVAVEAVRRATSTSTGSMLSARQASRAVSSARTFGLV